MNRFGGRIFVVVVFLSSAIGIVLSTPASAMGARTTPGAQGRQSKTILTGWNSRERTSSIKTTPVKVAVFGDSVALTLAFNLADSSLTTKYHYTLNNFGLLGCGVVMGPVIRLLGKPALSEPACNGAPPRPGTPLTSQPWPDQWKTDMSQVNPNVVVLLAGRWEDVDRIYNGQWTNILNPAFASYVQQQLELASNLVTATGAKMIFMTAPCTDQGQQPNGQPWPEDSPARLAVYNGLVRKVAAEHPSTDSVVDLDALVCPAGHFTPTYKGVIIRRPDGVHFTPEAGPVLARALVPPIIASGRAQMAATSKRK